MRERSPGGVPDRDELREQPRLGMGELEQEVAAGRDADPDHGPVAKRRDHGPNVLQVLVERDKGV